MVNEKDTFILKLNEEWWEWRTSWHEKTNERRQRSLTPDTPLTHTFKSRRIPIYYSLSGEYPRKGRRLKPLTTEDFNMQYQIFRQHLLPKDDSLLKGSFRRRVLSKDIECWYWELFMIDIFAIQNTIVVRTNPINSRLLIRITYDINR